MKYYRVIEAAAQFFFNDGVESERSEKEVSPASSKSEAYAFFKSKYRTVNFKTEADFEKYILTKKIKNCTFAAIEPIETNLSLEELLIAIKENDFDSLPLIEIKII